MRTVDYIVVGQGIAGTMVTYFLQESNQSVLVYDKVNEYSASNVAAGIVNPITGRYYVKSWMIDDLLPFANQTYQAFSDKLQRSFFTKRNIIRALFNHEHENSWLSRSARPGYEQYVSESLDLGVYQDILEHPLGYGEILQGGQVNLKNVVAAYRKYLQQEKAIELEGFDYSQLHIHQDHIIYNDVKAKGIVFSEGFKGKDNPYFSYLPFSPAKGEVLMLKIPNYQPEKIIKHQLFIVPIEEDLYWVGSNYQHQYPAEGPTVKGKKWLLDKLNAFIKVPYEIVEHKAAIRPTTKDRRPLIGTHPKYSNVHLFNGMGTKGASLSPYWANRLVEYLLSAKPLDDEVNIQRYQDLFEE